MNPETWFTAANVCVLAPWALLAFAPGWRWTQRAAGMMAPLLLSVAYFFVFVRELGTSGGGFGTLRAVMTLFENPWIALAGWFHYLAFDLFVGAWEVRDARRLAIPHAAVLPFLALTFILGPVGFGGYWVLRFALRREVETP